MKALISVIAITGCNTVSAFSGKGKRKQSSVISNMATDDGVQYKSGDGDSEDLEEPYG